MSKKVPVYYKTGGEVSYLLFYILATVNIGHHFGLWAAVVSILAFYPFTFLYFMLIVLPLNEFINKVHPSRSNW